jgi:NAD(P)-dependent dehydrogenase (short-subunit alcohol dehydrogenase family)
MSTLRGKKVLVIGGSSGIGLATAQAAAALGAAVTIASRTETTLRAAAATISGATWRVLDTTQDAAVDAFFADGTEWDHVAISAASTRTGPSRALPMSDAYAAMDSKFWGAFRCARAVSIAPDGSLTLVSGGLGHRASAGAVLQGAINAALEGLGRGLALELAPVRVNTVCPGLIDTPLLAKQGEAGRAARIAGAVEKLPVKRVGLAEDVAQAIIMLMGNRFATASTLVVDGGAAVA